MWQIIRSARQNEHTLHLKWHRDVPEGYSLDDVLLALGGVLSRHEALRTFYREEQGTLIQEVLAEGRLPVFVYEDPSTEKMPSALPGIITMAPFNHDQELPIRVLVLTSGGIPVSISFTLSHLSCDGESMRIIDDEFIDQLTSRDSETNDHGKLRQPLDVAIHERSEQGRRRLSATLDYCRGLLEEAAPTFFPDGDATTPARYWIGEVESERLAYALRELTTRDRVNRAAVLASAVATALSWRAGDQAALMQVAFSNRSAARGKPVGNYAHTGLALIRPADSLRNTLSSGAPSLLRAYRHADWNLDGLLGVKQEVERARQADIDMSCYFNYMQRGPSSRTNPWTAAEKESPPSATTRTFRWLVENQEQREGRGSPYTGLCRYSFSFSARDTGRTVMLRAGGDTRKMSPEQLSTVLHHIEEIVVEGHQNWR